MYPVGQEDLRLQPNVSTTKRLCMRDSNAFVRRLLYADSSDPSYSGPSRAYEHISYLGPYNDNWASTRENLSSGFVNSKGADQPPHSRRLISTFVIRFLENIIFKLTQININFLASLCS